MTTTISAPTSTAQFAEAVSRLEYVVVNRLPIAFVASSADSFPVPLMDELRHRCRRPFRSFLNIALSAAGDWTLSSPGTTAMDSPIDWKAIEEQLRGRHLAGMHTVLIFGCTSPLHRRSQSVRRLFDFAKEHPRSTTIIGYGSSTLLRRENSPWVRYSPLRIELDRSGR